MVENEVLTVSLLEGAKEIFETMVFMDVEDGLDDSPDIDGWALLGTITFRGKVEGCLGICCNIDCAKTIAVNMLGVGSIDEVNEDDTCDAMGEIANMLMGAVKSRIEDFRQVMVSIPSVVNGRSLKNSLGKCSTRSVVRLNLDGEFGAELTLLFRESSQ